MSSPAARLSPRPIRLYDSWWTVAAGALIALLALAAGVWCSLHMQADETMHTVALFAHLASLVLGFGAVLSADYYGLLWATGRCTLTEVLGATSRLHVPIWAGLGGLVFSGLMLHPDVTSPLTLTKLALVAVLTVNGLQAGLLGRRLEAATDPVSPRLLLWGGVTALVSQACWWGSVVIGFLNTNT
ncbi:hypothetical protein OOK31_12630 [Streptomyces sp. NBC_00249]|uniref:hypothetical protein n=1 Tax=Streptomyces sp. NBC_00249 TaxID=2975690 RepID=UPI002250FEED|nr:hypothetical protein [Streptomyces sp. NBC_00249]MCX5194732.1 hypothetical protein [Streptomyces sp. NBC_00249]